MSEKLRSNGEHSGGSVETSVESSKHAERLKESRNELAKQAENDPLQKHVESLARSAEQHAVSGKETNTVDRQSDGSNQSFGVHKALKKDAYKQTLHKIQGNLSAPERVVSRIIHQPTIDAVSNTAAKTVARPSGFLGGSIVAFLGSALFLYMSKTYGFTYNYTVLFALFIGGFALGLTLELLIRIFIRRKA